MKSEFIAGLTTFATMAYIIVINPQILSRTGIDFQAVMVATILVSALSTLLMGLYARYPFAVAPGMGLNAYFTYGIVLEGGFTWEAALGMTFVAGLIILILNLFGLRATILESVPHSLRYAATTGIGLFLIFIGFQNIGLIVGHGHTLVGMGSAATPAVALAALGIIITGSLRALKIEGALFIGIALITFLGWMLGLAPIEGVFALPPSLDATLFQLDLKRALQPDCWAIILTFVFLAVFDTAGTLYALSEQGGFVEKGKIPRLRRILTCDSIGTTAAGLLGTSPVTTYLESASGIAAGGRRGTTALFVALFFLLALFISPLISAIPLFATAPALIIVGGMMMESALKIEWNNPSEAIPASMIIAAIPLTYSIADGIGIGFVAYPFIKLLSGRLRETHFLTWIIAVFFLIKFGYA